MAISKGTQYITDPDSIPVNTSTGQQEVSEALESRWLGYIDPFEYEDQITDKPDPNDPDTWDWEPAFTAAAQEKRAIRLLPGRTYPIRSTVVIPNGSFDAQLFACLSGEAIIDGSSLGNGGAGFDDNLDVDDPSQPAYVPLIDIQNGSGRIKMAPFEGVRLEGNDNTALIRMKGCGGIRPRRITFGASRHGVVFSNDVAAGTFTEGCVVYDSVFSSDCLNSVYYEKGVGDRSFHGSGIKECWDDTLPNRPAVLISDGALPYNSPLEFITLKSGAEDSTDRPVIETRGAPTSIITFTGHIRTEKETPVLCGGSRDVALVGGVTALGRHTFGRLRLCYSARSHGSEGGNLNTVLNEFPRKTRYTVPSSGSTLVVCSPGKRSFVQVVATGLDVQFEVSSQRGSAGAAALSSVPVIYRQFGATLDDLGFSVTTNGIEITTERNDTSIMTVSDASGVDWAENSYGDYEETI